MNLRHSLKISNAVIATSISIPESICCFPNFKEKQKKERERKTEIYHFYQFIIPYYYDSLFKKKKLIHPMYCIYPFIIYPIYSPTSLQPFIYPFYNNNFCLFYYIYSLCIALPFIHLLYSIVSLIFFYFKICISSSCLN